MANTPEEPKRTTSSAFIDLGPKEVPLAKKMKVGGRIRVVLYGTVKGVSERGAENTEEGVESGTLEMTVSNMKLVSNNDIADLMEEDV